MKTTPHTIFIYSHGNFLRIVRGDHTTPDTAIKPRKYTNIVEALEHERRPRIVAALQRFPSDKLIDRRLKAIQQPVKVKSHRTLAESIKSPLFQFAQAGYDSNRKEIAYVYHRSPVSTKGIVMVKTGPVLTVRQLLKKYRKPALREIDRKRAVATA